MYAVITRDVVSIGDPSGNELWVEDPNFPGHKIQWWGRHVCFMEGPEVFYGGNVIGSTYIEVDDGRRIEAPYPFG